MSERPRVLLADDHGIVAAGLRRLLEDEYDVVGIAEDGERLLEMADDLKPDIIVLDISMPVINGLEALRRLRAGGSHARVIILTMHTDASYAREALDAGASAYLAKQAAAEDLTDALREVLAGGTYVSSRIASELRVQEGSSPAMDAPSRVLTTREREVVRVLAEGNSAKSAAHLLNVSTRTIEFHKYNAMEKLGLRTTAHLVQYAIKHGLISV